MIGLQSLLHSINTVHVQHKHDEIAELMDDLLFRRFCGVKEDYDW